MSTYICTTRWITRKLNEESKRDLDGHYQGEGAEKEISGQMWPARLRIYADRLWAVTVLFPS